MEDLLGGLNIPFERDTPLAPRTWYRLGGPASILAHPASIEQLSALAARCCERKVPVYVLGSGANLLVSDRGVNGVVIQLDDTCFGQLTIDGPVVTAGAGYDLMKLVLRTARAGLGGLESLAGIPATVGGAVRMNAGGAFGDIGRTVKRVQVMDNTGHVYYRDSDDLVFSYRKTNIVARFILSVQFELTSEDPDQVMRRVKEVFLYKKNSQPLAANSTGCAFKNPIAAPGHEQWGADGAVSAGKLIDASGLKGFRIGGAQVSPQHANFIIADEHATGADVLAVLEHVEKTVKDRFGVPLEREIVLWP